MRRIILCLLILCVSGSFCYAEEFNFRGVTWGMSRAEVQNIETGVLVPLDDVLKAWEENSGSSRDDESSAYMVALHKSNLNYDSEDNLWDLKPGNIFYTFTFPEDIGVDRCCMVVDDKLVMCGGGLSYNNDRELAFKDYTKILALLTAQYGEPDSKEIAATGETLPPLTDFVDELGAAKWVKVDDDFEINVYLFYDKQNDAIYISVVFRLDIEGATVAKWFDEEE